MSEGKRSPDSSSPIDAVASGDDDAPDYSFEGYSIEFLDKVGLMPVVREPPKPK